jgi:hypothetical protein
MGNFTVEDRFRSGSKYWDCKVDKFSARQNDLCVEVDGGKWSCDAVDFTTGDAKYIEWGPGKVTYDDLHCTYLMDAQSGGLHKLAHEIATGANGSKNRFNITLTFKDSAGKTQMLVNYLDCHVVEHSTSGFDSTDPNSPMTETMVFRPARGECKAG